MSVDYSQASIKELEANVLKAGELLLAADEEGGASGEARWGETVRGAIRELLRRGKEGEGVVLHLLKHANAEVALGAATVALDAQFNIDDARSALQRLTASRVGNGWPAHYAQKLLARYA